MRIASLALLCIALLAVPAVADNVYENGPVNGTTDAWTINFGYVVSDTFNIIITQDGWGFVIATWQFPGDTMTSLGWSITSAENSGTVYASGTATGDELKDQFLSTNQYGYNIDLITVSPKNVSLNPGTYWLNLQNASVPSGDPVYWDENSGVGCQSPGCPSQASESALGTIPSEAFTITGTPRTGTTPEPSSILLFGSGIIGLAGALRRKTR